MSAQEDRDMDLLLQRYLDGELPGREGTRLLLDAESNARLSEELEDYRSLFSLLDTMPPDLPSPTFDQRVLESVPYRRYATAPRSVWPTLVLAADPLGWLRALGRLLRSGAGAVFAAYLLFLAVGHSVLREAASAAASWLGATLAQWSQSAHSVPVLSTVLNGASAAYGLLAAGVGTLAHAWGAGVVTVLVGALLGIVLLAAVETRRGGHVAKGNH